MFYILDEDNIPMKVNAQHYYDWCSVNDIHVKFTKMPQGIAVSTVFLGVNTSYLHGNDKPILFETMIFGGELHNNQMRYHTWKEAEAGHNNALNKVFATIKECQNN